MNDKQILNTIDKYIGSRLYNYAMLINGEWGCGKTYFVTHTLVPYLQKKTINGNQIDVKYVSLYGIKETSEITDALLTQVIEDEIHKRTKMKKSGAHLVTGLLEKAIALGFRSVGGEEKDINELVSLVTNFDNNVIIFDDLERCSCDVNTVMGFINNFVEHSNSYVIIIANENEIGRWYLENNPELQMLVLLNKRFDVPVPLNNEEEMAAYVRRINGVSQPDNSEMRINPIKMRKMREYVFNSNEQYRQIKEKVVGITIDYAPDLKDVYEKVISNSSLNDALNTVMSKKIDYFVDIARRERYRNIRSFQFFLEKAKTIYEIVGEQPQYVYEEIVKYCFRATIRYMKGISQEAWDSEYGIRCFGSPFIENDCLYGFKFIDEFIETNIIVKDDVLSTISYFINDVTQMGKLRDDPVALISEWYLSDDERIISWMHEIKKNIQCGRYSMSLFPAIIKSVAVLEEHDIIGELGRQVIDSMKEYIICTNQEKIDTLGHEQFFLEGRSAQIYKQYMSELRQERDRVTQNAEKEQWNSLIKDKTQWALNLLSYVKSNNTALRSFVFWIEPEMLYSLILNSNNEQLFVFRQALAAVYNKDMSFFNKHDDYSNLNVLLRLLEHTDKSHISKTKAAHINWLESDVKKYLEITKPLIHKQNENMDITPEEKNT